MAHAPHPQAAPTSAKTRNLFRTEAPIIRLIIDAPRPVKGNGSATDLIAGILRGIQFEFFLALFRTERERLASILRGIPMIAQVLGVQRRATNRIIARSDFSFGVVRNNSCRPDAAFGVDEEVSRSHNAIALFQTTQYHYPVALCASDFDRARLKHVVAGFDVNDLLPPAIKHRFSRNGQPR